MTDKSITHLYSFDNKNLIDEESRAYISEGLLIMGIYSQDIASHCIRVSHYANEIGKHLRIPVYDNSLLWCSAILHDIGKTKIPVEILHKPAKLTVEEYEIVKTHPRKGYEIVNMNTAMNMVSDIILFHHERFDGKGYPLGIRGRELPLLSRIIAVADAFDAMTTDRPYKKAIQADLALGELYACKWTQFDGDIVDCLIELMESNYLKLTELNGIFDYA